MKIYLHHAIKRNTFLHFTFQYLTQGHTFLESPPQPKIWRKKQGAHLLLSCEKIFFIYTLKRKQTKKFGFFYINENRILSEDNF